MTTTKADGHSWNSPPEDHVCCNNCGVSVKEYLEQPFPKPQCPLAILTTPPPPPPYNLTEQQKERLWQSIVDAAAR